MRQTLTPEEAQAVARLRLEGAGDPSGVRVEDLAETIRISPEEVEFLLSRVHENRAQAARGQMEEHRKRDLNRVILAFIVSVLIVLGGVGAYRYRETRYQEAQIARKKDAFPGIDQIAPAMKMAEEMEKQAQKSAEDATKAPPAPFPPAEVDNLGFTEEEKEPPAGALPQVRVGTGPGSVVFPTEGLSLEAVAKSIDGLVTRNRPHLARNTADDAKTIAALKAGSDQDPALGRVPAWFFYGPGRYDAGAFLVVYDGSNPEAGRLAHESRMKVLKKMLGFP